MSKLCFRLLVVSLLVYSAGIVLAQKRPMVKTPSRVEAGKVASAEEPDFTRFRVVTDQGILAVFDADEEWDGRDEPYSQLAYWHDIATEQLFFFDQLLVTEADVLQSIAAIQRDLGTDAAQLITEKPEFGPLPAITSPGLWRPAVEVDVLAVMNGQVVSSAREVGGVSGLISPCAPIDCGPAAAMASGSLPAPNRGTPQTELFASAQSGSNCNCGGGPGPPPDPFRNIHAMAERLAVMEDDLLTNHFDPAICPFTRVTSEVLTTNNGTAYASSAPISLERDGIELRTGTVSVNTSDGSNSISLQVATTQDDGVPGPDPEWTLNQNIQLVGDQIRFTGSIIVVDSSGNSLTLTGGWTYSEVAGLVFDPSSDPGFQNALESMQGIEQLAVAGGQSPGTVLSFAANVITMAINYLRDSLHPYTQPTSCSGPVFEDGTSLSCETDEIPCYAVLDDIALKIHNLTNVSNAFKKCMMGRLDCRGSNNRQYSHPQIRVKCTISSLPSCGPCIVPPAAPNGPAWGCNLGGRHIWYCRPSSADEDLTPNEIKCECAMVVFHEASHACGAQDFLPHDANYSSYRIGFWFENRCLELLNPPEP